MNKKLIIFNAPPNAGKDHAALHLEKQGVNHLRFKDTLYDLAKVIYNLDDTSLFIDRDNKETPNEKLNGLSPRQALIRISEECIKPIYGKGFFGKSLADRLVEGLNVTSDGGFTEEIDEVVKVIGAENVYVIEIYTEGCTFEGDSRSYIGMYANEKGCTIGYLDNNKDKQFLVDVDHLLEVILQGKY